MDVALGFKSHSGWAAMVAIGKSDGDYSVIERGRIELIDEGEFWAKQPYHAAENLKIDEAKKIVDGGIEMARRVAIREMRACVKRLSSLKYEITACAVLVPDPMPEWGAKEILAVHFRMHKAEGVLFPDALCRAAKTCGLPLAAVPEKHLEEYAEKALKIPFAKAAEKIAVLGKSVGPPWGKDQKNATLAAMTALK